MSSIPVKDIIAQFQRMYTEHWSYEWGAAREGCVDCSGAFVYVYRLYGLKIAHGSNTIARKYVGELLPISKAEPGMAAFKVREWKESESGNSWYGKAPGDVYHIGLVDEDVAYVLNAKGTNYGFCRDRLTAKNGWDFVARLDAVEYGGGGGGGTTMTVTISGGNTAKPINMRASSTAQSKIIAEIPQGSSAELVREDGTWDKITYNGQTGYVMAKFVQKGEQPEPEPTGDTVTVKRADLEDIYNKLGDMLGLRG